VEQGASEAQALHCAGRESTHLAVKGVFQTELLREMRDALSGGDARKVVETAEEAQIFAAGKPGVEADIAASVIAELATNGPRIENGVVTRDLRAACGGKQQRSENTKECGFTGAICAKQRQGFAGAQFEGNTSEGDDARLLERLEKSSPATAGGRKKFFESSNAYRSFGHDETYSVSLVLRQSAREGRQPATNRELHSLRDEGHDSSVECKRSNS